MSDDVEQESAEQRVLILPELERSLAALTDVPTDGAARSLALRYALLMDDAQAADKYTKALRLCGEAIASRADDMPITAGEQLMSAWDKLSSALAEHSVASDLGPKLLAALTALGMTPAGRAQKAAPTTPEGGQAGGGKVEPIKSTLQLLRGEAATRRQGPF